MAANINGKSYDSKTGCVWKVGSGSGRRARCGTGGGGVGVGIGCGRHMDSNTFPDNGQSFQHNEVCLHAEAAGSSAV